MVLLRTERFFGTTFFFYCITAKKKIDIEVIKRVKFTFFNHNNAV